MKKKVREQNLNYIVHFDKYIAMAFKNHPRRYQHSTSYPVLRGPNHCQYCLCAPCVIRFPPEFLRGSCSPHPANAEKRYTLYRKFWGLLKDLGVWRDESCLIKKQQRTAKDDRRDIMPDCCFFSINIEFKILFLYTGDKVKISQS